MTIRKSLSFLLALAIAAPMATAFADDPATPATTSPEVTVVGKRIIGDDNYFEISLEVNGDYEDYGSIDVTLEYDPSYIVPADSWDDEAGAADMTECTSWATRRALPTLGKDTWKTHTALTYIEPEEKDEETGAVTKKAKGYLYLGAEYNHKYGETGTDPTATADPAADPTPDPTPSPTVDPENTYANPVVAVRFMYTGADKDAKKAKKADLIKVWTEKSGTQTKTYNEDWYQGSYEKSNPILRIAPDEICLKQSSPSKYGFTYKDNDADSTRRAFMYSFPAAAAAVTATGEPRATFAPGSSIAEENRLTDTDIEIVTDEGKTAKSGGLTLNDVFAIVFLDWDNSVIGVLSAAVGAKDMAASVNNYVNEKLVYEDLRADKKDYFDLVSSGDYLKRENSYRGEYPYDKPSSTNPTIPVAGASKTVLDGEDYPLTNKLDYVFAGKDIDPALPFANGWVQVTTKTMDYSDTTLYPGKWKDVLPNKMDETFTWWTATGNETFGRAPELDINGALVNASDKIPDIILYDFDNITENDLQYGDGNLYFKAAYEKGEKLNGEAESNYAVIGDADKSVAIQTSATTVFSIKFHYRRINKYGYGVNRIKKPGINMSMSQVGASASTSLGLYPENSEDIEVELTPSDAVQTVGYVLRETYKSSVVLGAYRSLENEIGQFEIAGASGLAFKISAEPLLDQGHKYVTGVESMPSKWPALADLKSLNLYASKTGAAYNSKTYTKAKTPMTKLLEEAGNDYNNLTWYQLQYAVLQTAAPYYVDNAIAKKFCDDNGLKF